MPLRIVIVGGVAGGMSAATRARRMNEHASITVLEKGNYISFANCGLPYYLAGRIQSQDKLLLTNPQLVRKRFNIDVRIRHEAIRVDRQAKVVGGVDHATGKAFELPYDKLILAPGADAIVPPIDHVKAPNVFVLRSMEDTFAIEQWMKTRKPAKAVIVGAGFIGLEMAEALREKGIAVTLVEKAPHVLPPLDPQLVPWVEQELAKHEVRVIAGTGLSDLVGSGDLATAVELEDGRQIEADMVLLSIGVRPNTRLAKEAGLAIGPSGAIAVDAFMRTSDHDIYAVGDVAEVVHAVTGKPARIPLAGPANRHGRTAGEHAATGEARPAGRVLGTAIVGVFDIAAGVTGLGEKAARDAGFDIDTAYVHPAHHAGYYPGAQQMHLKLIYDRPTGRILGAQAVGGEGIDKRLDVIATAIHFGGTIDDLTDLDLAYAPQFGSAKDPIHMAAFVAQNQQRGLTPAVDPGISGEMLLDVRTPEEFAKGTLPGAVNIPVDELRGRLAELDKGRPMAVFCQVGQRGHLATRILRQNGFEKVRNIKGGYLLASNLL